MSKYNLKLLPCKRKPFNYLVQLGQTYLKKKRNCKSHIYVALADIDLFTMPIHGDSGQESGKGKEIVRMKQSRIDKDGK